MDKKIEEIRQFLKIYKTNFRILDKRSGLSSGYFAMISSGIRPLSSKSIKKIDKGKRIIKTENEIVAMLSLYIENKAEKTLEIIYEKLKYLREIVKDN